MDINYLLAREQTSLIRARFAACTRARRAHVGLADGYGALLRRSTYPHRRAPTPAVASC